MLILSWKFIFPERNVNYNFMIRILTTNLSLLDNSQTETYLTSNSLKVGVVGIGRIGLPTALCFANSGFETVGIDINQIFFVFLYIYF